MYIHLRFLLKNRVPFPNILPNTRISSVPQYISKVNEKEAGRTVFPAPSSLCFHKSQRGRALQEWAGAGAPTVTLGAPVAATLASFLRLLPLLRFSFSPSKIVSSVVSLLLRFSPSYTFFVSSSRNFSSFKCFFMWLRRFVTIYLSFFSFFFCRTIFLLLPLGPLLVLLRLSFYVWFALFLSCVGQLAASSLKRTFAFRPPA